MSRIVILTTLIGLLAACGGGGGEGAPPAAPAGPGAAPAGATAAGAPGAAIPTTFKEQVAAGQPLYAEHCAKCHGEGGEGGSKAPRVVGMDKGALPLEAPPSAKLRKARFRSAADVGDFVAKNMPPNKAGTLSEWQYWAILAFDLHANGVMLDKPLDATSAKEVVIHP